MSQTVVPIRVFPIEVFLMVKNFIVFACNTEVSFCDTVCLSTFQLTFLSNRDVK